MLKKTLFSLLFGLLLLVFPVPALATTFDVGIYTVNFMSLIPDVHPFHTMQITSIDNITGKVNGIVMDNTTCVRGVISQGFYSGPSLTLILSYPDPNPFYFISGLVMPLDRSVMPSFGLYYPTPINPMVVGWNLVSEPANFQFPTCSSNPPPVADSTPPVIVPTITPAPNTNGWNNSDTTVSWSVTDPESPISSKSGCMDTKFTTDTPGTTITCIATSTGGTSSQSATIKLDKTPPSLTFSGFRNQTATGYDNTKPVVPCGSINSSGFVSWEWLLNNTEPEPVIYSSKLTEPVATVSANLLADTHIFSPLELLGTYTMQVTAKDVADNVSTPISCTADFKPTDDDQCKKDGWKIFGVFKNQGQCVSYVEHLEKEDKEDDYELELHHDD